MEHDFPRLLKFLHRDQLGLGMFSQDIAESINRLLKDAFINFTARGGGDGGELDGLRQAWVRVFLEFEVALRLSGGTKVKVGRGARCVNRDAWRAPDSDDDAE